MTTQTVFISYSHKDEAWKDLLVPHLRALEMAGLDMQVWHDRRINGGDKWYPEIQAAIESSTVAVLLISPDFLASEFCVKEEVPALIRRQEQKDMLLIPVLVRACPWKAHRWLRDRQMIPRDGQCVAIDHAGALADAVWTQVAEQVQTHLEQSAHPVMFSRSWTTAPAKAKTRDAGTDQEPLVDLTHLPETGSTLFGRDAELELLDKAWAPTNATAPPIRAIAFTAHGGVGKSTLINHWLAEMKGKHYRGAQRVFGWSFYSQGVHDQSAANSDLFINTALKFFGDTDPTAGAAWDKGQRLANLIGSQRSLLVLDGLEPLQSGHAFERGKLSDPAIESLLRGLASQSQGLCLISTREVISDLAGKPGFHTHDLEQISPQAGRALLRTLRVVGSDAELEDLAHRFGPHALTISLLGVYLREQPGRGVGPAAVLERMPGDTPLGRVLAGFEKWLGESAELDALRLLGLFDRPADEGCLAALRQAPAIPGLNSHLVRFDSTPSGPMRWETVSMRLNSLRLAQQQPDFSLDAHPLIREYFAKQLQAQQPEAWQAAHQRLYEHLCANTKEGARPTLVELQPLYQAVAHGCLAGLQQRALVDVFIVRIRRQQLAYSTHKLGAFSSDLGAARCFFEVPWSRVSNALSATHQSWLRNVVAFCLYALGHLEEAIAPMHDALRATVTEAVTEKDWKIAAALSSNLSQLEVTLGQIEEEGETGALWNAAQAVKYAERSGDFFERISKRAGHADVLHQMGQWAEANELFRAAEALQAEYQPHYPMLYSFQGYQYCDLLLAPPECSAWRAWLRRGDGASGLQELEKIEQRVRWALQVGRNGNLGPATVALDHLAMGRVTLYGALAEDADFSLHSSGLAIKANIAGEVSEALRSLRMVGAPDHLLRCLLTQAWLRSLPDNAAGPDCAQFDLDEAWEIAERGPMPLYMADIHLHRARLFLRDAHYPWNTNEDGTPRGPADDLREARRLIEKHGYGRRLKELQDAEEALRQ